METKVAVISIIVENPEAVEQLNHLLHAYRDDIIGRMGIPYREKGLHIICVALDAPQAQIDTLTAQLAALEGISAKATCCKP